LVRRTFPPSKSWKEDAMGTRGRPKGSKFDDSRYMHQVADLLLAKAAKSARDAMLQVYWKTPDMKASEQTVLRRWQSRWKEGKGRFMEAAQVRSRPSQVTIRRSLPSSTPSANFMMAAFERTATGALWRTLQIAEQMDITSTFRTACAAMENHRLLMENSATYQMMKSVEDTVKQVRQYDNMLKGYDF
jgi:hypothetical protein